MEIIEIKLKTKSPLLIKANNDDANLISSLDYIPGSQLRGKLAQYLLEDQLYEDIFLDEQVRFNNLYLNASQKLPLSAFSCKYYPGFKSSSQADEKHGVYDFLLDRARVANNLEKKLAEQCEEKISKNDPILGSRIKNKDCESVLNSFGGYYSEKDGNYYSQHLKKRNLERTALDLKNESAKDGSLYIMECIEEEQEFSGTIEIETANTEIADKLKTVLAEIEFEYFGSAKSRGHGKVELDFSYNSFSQAELIAAQKKDFENLNQQIEDDNYYFTLTLEAEAIIYDDFLRAKKKIKVEDLLNYTHYLNEEEKEALAEFSLVEGAKGELYFADLSLIYGWNSLMRLPKPIQLGISRGSCFIYQGAQAKVEKEILLSALQKIQCRGIGERLNEGYGKVSINDKFHYHNLQEGK